MEDNKKKYAEAALRLIKLKRDKLDLERDKLDLKRKKKVLEAEFDEIKAKLRKS